MSLSFRIISIGTLSRNRFWDESAVKRSAHSTTTLIRDGNTSILVDPGLPVPLLTHFLDERAGITPDEIEAVFLTCYRPVHRRALSLFDGADWYMFEPEIEAVRGHLQEMSERSADDSEEQGVEQLVTDELALLDRIKPAADKMTERVHLFPCQGITPGSAGLLLIEPSRTTVVAGDAVINREYFDAGRIYEQVADVETAQDAFGEVMEIADAIIPGHDNIFTVPGR
jgi:glyoxylase-like metal-dependent hydrolase (beta-lactamase superfamily II)